MTDRVPEARWQRVKDIFGAALELPAAEREAYLRDACGTDDALRREVEQLLRGQSAAGEFLSKAPGLAEPERPPALAPGRSLGTYEIVAAIGAGGMGEVYRARDSHLGREVAIKVLPDVFGKDPERLSRFAREARLLASLNHPNIAAVHGFEESDGTRFLIMELVPGETLAERLREGPLPMKQALSLAQQIAEALEEAHAKGIVHRDLKPANVKVSAGGKVKVLDFGLAKALAPESQSVDPSHSPTLTRTGAAILGTAAYMSPEQARGKPVDKRTDVWAFGCVLYEMLTRRAPFEGETTSDVIASILKHEPDWAPLPAETPASVRGVLRRCLQKDPHQRLHDIADARIELGETLSGAPAPGTPVPPPASSRTRERLAWTLAALAAALATAAGIALLGGSRRVTTQAQPVSFLVNPPDNTSFAPTADSSFPPLAISPDGRHLAFVALGTDRVPLLWVRRLDSVTPVPVPGTEGAAFPFWSPDGRQLGFFARGKLKKVKLEGGTPQSLADAAILPRGATWNKQDVILYSPYADGGLFRISADGGSPSPVTELDASVEDTSHRWPQFLPDGRHFLFVRRARRPQQGIYVGSLDSKTITQLNEESSNAAYAPPNHVLFARSGALMAAPFDGSRQALVGQPFAVMERIGHSPSIFYAAFTVSSTGVLVYASGGASMSRLQWFDRKGQPLETVGEPGDYAQPKLSPDEKQVAVARLDPQTSTYDLWLHDFRRGSASRFTFDSNSERWPVWAPDGKTIAFSSLAARNIPDLVWKPTSGATQEETLLGAPLFSKHPTDWSRDGRWIVAHVFSWQAASGNWDIYLYDTALRKAAPFLAERANELQGQLSRDGRWIAYASDESGRYEVYVQPFPTTGPKWQISTNGGSQPRWRGDGKELFYAAPDGKLMAVGVQAAAGSFQVGVPQPLFATQMPSLDNQFDSHYSVSADGQRFLVTTRLVTGASPLTVVTNWSAAQRRE